MNFNELREVANYHKAARTIQVACDFKLFDLLASESRTAEGIADNLKSDPRSTELFCNALAGIGLLEKSNNRFSNTETAQKYLVTSSPLYYGWIIRHNSHSWESWGRLSEAISSGKKLEWPAVSERDEGEMEAFIMGMHSIITAGGDAELLAGKLGLNKAESILDLGGGPATFSIVFCQRHEKLSATVFDLPVTVKIAEKNLSKYSDVKDKITFVEGDFFVDELPSGFDVVFISNIIHMCNEEENLELMKRVYSSLNPGGRIIVKDFILNEDRTLPPHASIFSLHMLLHTSGRSYNFAEIEGWLKEAGCSQVEGLELPKKTPFGIIVGNK